MIKSNFLLYSVVVFAFVSLIVSNVALADVIPPKKQTKLGFSVEEILCKDGFVKVIKKIYRCCCMCETINS